MTAVRSDAASTLRWLDAGLFLVVFATVALFSPGRIDIVDGQTRYEVAKSLVEHGDAAIRDARVWFQVYPGRGDRPYTTYRLPQSLLGTGAIVAADLVGPTSEARRRFFFVWTSAAVAAALAVAYAAWFRARGLAPGRALAWAVLGIVATPLWFYGTSTFDDVLGSWAVVLAVVAGWRARAKTAWTPHVVSALALGFAFHCKPPLAAYVLLVLAAGRGAPVDAQRRRMLILGALLAAAAVHLGYDRYKFGPENAVEREALKGLYVSSFPGNPLAGLLSFAVSPGKGLLWYCPALVLGLVGWLREWRRDRWLALAFFASAATMTGFFASLTIFSGDPAWGPRYLTPVVALLWLMAPAGAAWLGRIATAVLLGASVLVQLSSLAVDPHRLYVEQSLPSAFYYERPWVYFDSTVSHLVQRPREILQIAGDLRANRRAARFTPAPEPTFTFPVLDYVDQGPTAVERYQVLAALRPFWASQVWLPPEARPVDIPAALAFLASCGLAGGGLVWRGLRQMSRAG